MSNEGGITSPQMSSSDGAQSRPPTDPVNDLMESIIKPQSQLISVQLDESNFLLR